MNIYDDPEFFGAYAQMDRSAKGLAAAGEWPQLRRLFTDIAGKEVLDLGCGYGWHARYAIEQGAKAVLGIDGSARMLEKAAAMTDDDRVRYVRAALEDCDLPDNAFDIVLSNLSLHYAADLHAIYRKVYTALRPGGYFLINIEHPVFTAGVGQNFVTDGEGRSLYWPLNDYFIEGERETDFLGMKVRKYHHTLTTVLNGLLRCDFTLAAVEEVCPDKKVIEENGWQDELKRPMMLLIKAYK